MSDATPPEKKQDGFKENAQVFVGALIIALIIRSLLFQPFNIPSAP